MLPRAVFVPRLHRRLEWPQEPCVPLRTPQHLPRRLRPLVLPERALLPMLWKLRRTHRVLAVGHEAKKFQK